MVKPQGWEQSVLPVGTYWTWGQDASPTLETLQKGHHFQVPSSFCLWEEPREEPTVTDQQPGLCPTFPLRTPSLPPPA